MKTGQIRLHTMCHFNELNFKIMQSIKHFAIENNMGFGPRSKGWQPNSLTRKEI